MEAIRIIQDEHRSLAAVLHGMLYLVHETRDRGAKSDFDLLGAMVYYIDAFPERMLRGLGYFGPATGAAEAVRRQVAGADTAVVRVVPARPGIEAIRAVLAACRST